MSAFRNSVAPGETFIEVGCGLSPVPLIGKMAFQPGSQYIGIEDPSVGAVTEKSLFYLRQDLSIDRPDLSGRIIKTGIQNVAGELDEACADEVFMNNVLSDPRIPKRSIGEVLKSARSLLKDDKRLVVMEAIIPRTMDRASLESHLRPSGFIIDEGDFITSAMQERWAEIVPYYDNRYHMMAESGYAYIASARKS